MMTEKQPPEEIEQETQADDMQILFDQLLHEVRASNCNDRTRMLIDSMNDEIKDLMQAVNKYGKNGEITLNIKFKVIQANEMEICAEIKSKKPKGKATGTKMFTDQKGRLYLDDPNQMKLFDNVHSINKRR